MANNVRAVIRLKDKRQADGDIAIFGMPMHLANIQYYLENDERLKQHIKFFGKHVARKGVLGPFKWSGFQIVTPRKQKAPKRHK